MENLIYVVGTAFIRDGKLLISMSQRSAKKGRYTLVGGGVEKGETFTEDVDVELMPNDEIIEYKWFKLGDDDSQLASAIKDHFIPWAIENRIMY